MNQEKSYFIKLNAILQKHERSIPCMVVDLNLLDKNLNQLKKDLNPNAALRLVVKSLPSFELIRYILHKMSARRLMVFHQPFLSNLSSLLDDRVDILIGKPLPIRTAEYYFAHLPTSRNGFDPIAQIQWLVDTDLRTEQYITLAKRLKQRLRLNLEIDVGLHRGGFRTTAALKKALDLLSKNKQYVCLGGLMGYDPHIAKIPSILRSKKKSMRLSANFYEQCKTTIEEEYPDLWHQDLVFNGAGSPTLNVHSGPGSPLNDISIGSCLVKPTSFDLPSLAKYQPACFIAAPVLKKFGSTMLPGLEKWRRFLSLISPSNQNSYFIYGGHWKADYCYPKSLRQNQLFGASTNQTMLNAPASSRLEIDDFVFLRPHQSEFVLLQFGEILVIKDNQITDTWNLLNNR